MFNALRHPFWAGAQKKPENELHITWPIIGLEQAEQCPFGTVETPCWVMLRSRSSINAFRLTLFDGKVADTAGTWWVDGVDTGLSDWAGIIAARPDCIIGCWLVDAVNDSIRLTGPDCLMSEEPVNNSSPLASCKQWHQTAIMKPLTIITIQLFYYLLHLNHLIMDYISREHGPTTKLNKRRLSTHYFNKFYSSEIFHNCVAKFTTKFGPKIKGDLCWGHKKDFLPLAELHIFRHNQYLVITKKLQMDIYNKT